MDRIALTISLATLLFACDAGASPPSAPPSDPEPASSSSEAATPERSVEADDVATDYPWFVDMPDDRPRLIAMERRFPAPDGWERVELEAGSFGAFLRDLPIRKDRQVVRSYKGEPLGSPAAAIVYLDVGDANLQQCADSALRLHAEWLWASNRRHALAYHFTSGDRTAWSDYAAGERFRISGSKVKRVRSGKASRSRRTFRDWLKLVFTYAGTRSLALDSEPVSMGDIRPGDFFVAPGSPGHAVVVLDLVRNEEGRQMALLGQGFMPAQDFHVIEGTDAVDEVWWPVGGDELKTPSWRAFQPDELRRFRGAESAAAP